MCTLECTVALVPTVVSLQRTATINLLLDDEIEDTVFLKPLTYEYASSRNSSDPIPPETGRTTSS